MGCRSHACYILSAPTVGMRTLRAPKKKLSADIGPECGQLGEFDRCWTAPDQTWDEIHRVGPGDGQSKTGIRQVGGVSTNFGPMSAITTDPARHGSGHPWRRSGRLFGTMANQLGAVAQDAGGTPRTPSDIPHSSRRRFGMAAVMENSVRARIVGARVGSVGFERMSARGSLGSGRRPGRGSLRFFPGSRQA